MRILLLSLALVGCATPAQRAASLDSPTLCYIHYAGSVSDKQATAPELRARGFTCTPEAVQQGQQNYQALQAQQARRGEALDALGAALILQGTAPSPAVTCTTVGNYPHQITTCR